MAVVITEDEHITIIHYAEGKRPIKIEPFVVTSAEDADILQDIIRFIHVEANSPHHIAKMEDAKFFALVELLATKICYAFSPKTEYGINKSEIRGIVLFVLQAATEAGEWLDSYHCTDRTFVQFLRGYLDE
ncbi:MAG: hypothetical protein E7L01_01925 [Paenibacillus macerans]|uniref:hypothetical protein n=1 Tax=Paenibacillus TaxID=44249 RepID=UPI0029108730|nr:hypothetical protein [Paenibacillus macerans]MDU7472108.1 hypothetical protein [Paenibacillus macerans]